ncbi:MAG: hypothetical protein FWD45_06590 [Coriobacteriia bacterium]|nr:hypothetical protein [Coriobacteriia bacterium]
MLSVRRTRVLNALVDEHVHTTLPVSSSVLARHYLPGVSAATIRNELLGLENQGLAFSPHTSAGRIPTNQGYRFFVNHLLLSPQALTASTPFHENPATQIANEIATEASNETAITAQIADSIPLTGHAQIRQVLEVLSKTTGLLSLFWDREGHLGLIVRGMSRLMAQPEFSDSNNLLPLMVLIEDQDSLIMMMESGLRSSDLSVLIGLETSGVLANYTLLLRRQEGRTAIFGLLGPTRMEYRRALAVLDSIARLI